MKDAVFASTIKRSREREDSVPPPHNRQPKKHITKSAIIDLQHFDFPLISPSTGSPLKSLHLDPDRPYTIGRANRHCDFLFKYCFVSKQHCQILFDSFDRKIYILDGKLLPHRKNDNDSRSNDFVSEFRRRLTCYNELGGLENDRVRVSLNGVFVNGVKVRRGSARELCAGDEVFLVCGNEGVCSLGVRVGFLIQAVVFKEEFVAGLNERNRLFEPMKSSMGHSQGSVSSGRRSKRVSAIRGGEVIFLGESYNLMGRKCGDIYERAEFLLRRCREILCSEDPMLCIGQCPLSDFGQEIGNYFNTELNCSSRVILPKNGKDPVEGEKQNSFIDRHIQNGRQEGIPSESDAVNNDFNTPLDFVGKENASCIGSTAQVKNWEKSCPPPGKKFYLNRLNFMEHGSFSHHNVISLPELLHPLESIVQIFIATFTSDILWFLSYCGIPCHLPITISCHNTERCWSSSPDKRTSMPFSDFPNLVLVFPPFPEAIAFGKDRKRQGIACHHPKLFVLQRDDSLRVIITSANLVPNQWNNVTNTVWWQDFPRRSAPDISSLFVQVSIGEANKGSRSDFAAQLAGFMASLVIDVPSQAHWIIELTKYNFEGAMGHLVASVPGIHSCRPPNSFGETFLGSVEASVVGLSHLFHTAADRNGAQLKQLAAFLSKSCRTSYGKLEVVLRRNTNVSVDANAVSVLVSNPDQFSDGDCIQLGFLPRNVAKWVSPLWDSGFLRFSGYIYSKEALAAASGGSSIRVQLILHVFQGTHFLDMMRRMQPEHVAAFCFFIASIQRCTGLWRLQEVLGQYKWPESEESDFIYGSSSIGSSVNAQFLAAFSAAAGKRSLQLFDSEESDPEWGCWRASQELRSPSIRIIFPTIERVKNEYNGILSSRHILCFSEKTWQRLRPACILHDAVPHPSDRMGHPMHTKVARRRFQSRTDGSSLGWVYCGSHNFSSAAWGQPISNPLGLKSYDGGKTNSSLGLGLRVCNYELGIIFVFPPTETGGISNNDCAILDDITLPFFMPAPKYVPTDRPATKYAMREALAELAKQERERLMGLATTQELAEEIPDEEEEVIEATDYVVEEKEEEKAYAEMLWSQVNSSQSR